MENRGLEPLTLGLQSRCSEPTELIPRAPRARQGEEKEGRDGAGSPSRAYTARLRGLFSAAGSPSLRKEVIQPHLPVRLPCYDFTPLTGRTFDSVPLAVGLPASGTPHSDGVTGGEYKTRERIHRSMADLRLLAIPASWSRVADSNPNWDVFYRFAPSRDIASYCIRHCSTCVAPDIRAMMT